MSTSYTSLLGFALPATGELSGTWGDTVNNSITTLLDSAIAGTTTIVLDQDVTLSSNDGTADTSRQAIILWTAGGSATRTITAPGQSKIYTVINASSGTQSIILNALATTGVTIAKGESALVAWNGSDFIKISNTAGPGTFTDLTVTGNTTLGNDVSDTITVNSQFVTGTVLRSAQALTNTLALAAYDVDGTAYTNLITLTAANAPTLALTSTGVGTINNMSIGATTASTGAFTTLSASSTVTLSGGTENGVAYLNGSKAVTSGSALVFDGTNLGVGTASLSSIAQRTIDLNAASNSALVFKAADTSIAYLYADNAANEFRMYGAASKNLTFYANASEGMRLTSTSLYTASTINVAFGTSTIGARLTTQASANSYTAGALQINSLSGTYKSYITNVGGSLLFSNSSTVDQLTLDSSGNLGLGVTPNANWATLVGLQVSTTAVLSGQPSAEVMRLGSNWYFGGGFKYLSAATATRYDQNDGKHSWYNAPAGANAGDPINFTQAMTLDASGRLLVNSTSLLDYSTVGYSGRVQIAQSGNAQLVCAGFASGADYGGEIILSKSNSNTIGTNSIVQNNDKLGTIFFAGANGTGYSFAAHIRCLVDGTPGASADMPGALLFSTSSDGSATPTERMRLDRRGNLGLGVTPSAFGATYRAFQATGYAAYVGDGNRGHADMLNNAYVSADLVFNYFDTNSAGRYSQQLGGHYWYSAGSGSANAAISWGDPKMSLDTSGNLIVGAGSAYDASYRGIQAINTTGGDCAVFTTTGFSGTVVRWNKATSGDNQFIDFYTETSITPRGSITYNRAGGLTAYNVTSDYRAKDISGPVVNSGALIDSVPVYMGKMKDATQERPMFIAHETPVYAHTGEKDAVDKDGKPVYQQMDASALIPVMWAEIQSLRKRLAAAGI